MSNEEIKRKTIQVLENGGIILYPTDTLIGLGCDALNVEAVSKIYEMKDREEKKPMSIACADLSMIKKYCDLTAQEERALLDLLPGPYTFILNKKDNIPEVVTAGSKKVGVRIPDYPLLLDIVKDFNKPIITTSANKSGEPDISSLNESDYLVDYIVDSPYQYKGGSTVIDISNLKILREGIGLEKIKEYFNL